MNKSIAEATAVHAFENDVTSSVGTNNKIELKQSIVNQQLSYKYLKKGINNDC